MRLPDNTQRLAIVGRTGSGKTVAALWHLSQRDFDRHPWLIIDYKHDNSIDQIPGLQEIAVTDKPPKRAGLYVVRPFPEVDDDALETMLMKVWERGKTGIYLDEGYMIGRFNKSYRAILTQGRSKHIPVITLSQRPAWISPFIFSESEFIQSYHLQTPRDIARMQEFMPGADIARLPDYHSYYWSVPDFEMVFLKPVPKLPEILNRFEDKMVRHRYLV